MTTKTNNTINTWLNLAVVDTQGNKFSFAKNIPLFEQNPVHEMLLTMNDNKVLEKANFQIVIQPNNHNSFTMNDFIEGEDDEQHFENYGMGYAQLEIIKLDGTIQRVGSIKLTEENPLSNALIDGKVEALDNEQINLWIWEKGVSTKLPVFGEEKELKTTEKDGIPF